MIEQEIRNPQAYAQYLKSYLPEGADLPAGERARDNACPIWKWLTLSHPDYLNIRVNQSGVTYYQNTHKKPKTIYFIDETHTWIRDYIHLIDSKYMDEGEVDWKVTYQQAWDALCQVAPQVTTSTTTPEE